MIKCRQHEIVQNRLESDGRIVRQSIAQRQGTMCGQFGDEPIGERLDGVIVLLLDGFRRCATDGDDRTLDRAIGI